MKKCTICKLELEVNEFGKDKSRGDGLSSHCKKCNTIKQKKYAERNREKIKAINKKSSIKNRERRKQINLQNKDKLKSQREKRKDRIKKYSSEYYLKNKKKINERAKIRERNKKKNDPQYKLNSVISTSIYQSLKIFNLSKSKCGWQNAVGYTLEELVKHLESQFDENMNWQNYGSYWHIDHIKPKSLFEFKSLEDEEFKKCWALNNLRPLEAKENIRKSNKYNQ